MYHITILEISQFSKNIQKYIALLIDTFLISLYDKVSKYIKVIRSCSILSLNFYPKKSND